MGTIFIDNPRYLSKGSEIRSYENFDRKLFDLIDELNKTVDGTTVMKYVFDDNQEIINNAMLCIIVHNKHAYVCFIDNKSPDMIYPGWCELYAQNCKMFEIHLGFRTPEKKDFSISFISRERECFKLRVFHICNFDKVYRRYAEMICYMVTPKYYLELIDDCLEFSKLYCKIFVKDLIGEEKSLELDNVLKRQLFVITGAEILLRNPQYYYIYEKRHVFMKAFLIFVVIYLVINFV